jgi:hypothetical protein
MAPAGRRNPIAGVLRLLGTTLVPENLAGMPAGKPSFQGLTEVIAHTMSPNGGVEVGGERSVDAIEAGPPERCRREGAAECPDRGGLPQGVCDLAS